jgi:tRNA(Ile)-lysidine synthase
VLNTSLNLQRSNSWISGIVNDFKSNVSVKHKKSVSIPAELIKKSNEFITSYSIKEIIDENFLTKLESGDVKKILSLVKKQSGKSEELSENLIAQKERNEIIVKKKDISKKSDTKKLTIGSRLIIDGKTFSIVEVDIDKIKINNNKNEEYISAEKLDKDFIIRRWKTGDKFFPIGMQGTKKISDYLNDLKINSFEKAEQLILENRGRIVWVIGKRLDDRFKLTNKTKKVLKLCLK